MTTRADDAAGMRASWARERAIAEDALALPRDGRDAFLDATCHDDPALRARAGRLVAACEGMEGHPGFLARCASELAGPFVPEVARAIDRLGPAFAERYRLEHELGVGGTATVYRAHDVRHGRPVAIKVLHPEHAAVLGAERFLAEIRTMAALQHPHILPLFDSGAANGLLFFVMPLVEDTLRERLTREGRLAVADAVRMACEVAGAIDYAHRHGVIHRDVKPENILLHDGRPLVADFGIALTTGEDEAHRITQPGLSPGTPRYMSPEQATGERELTARSDVHALGVLAYEMLTGAPPFAGATVREIVERVSTERPRAIRVQRPEVPLHVESALLIALEKAPAKRFASAAELARALDGGEFNDAAREGPGVTDAGVERAALDRQRALVRSLAGALAALVVLVVALAGIAAWEWSRARRATGAAMAVDAPRGVVRFTLLPPPGQSIASSGPRDLAISPDGRLVVFVATDSAGTRRLHARALDAQVPRVVAGTEGASAPFFSPDGEWIGFRVRERLLKVEATGGAPRLLATIPGGGGAAWVRSDVIVVAGVDGLSTLASTGGVPRLLAATDAASGETARTHPIALADGDHVLYASRHGRERAIGIASLSARSSGSIGFAGADPVGVVGGELVYATSDGVLMSVPVDLARARAAGVAVPVATSVRVGATGAAHAAVSHSGTLAYRRVAHGSADDPGIVVVLEWGTELRAPARPRTPPR